MIDICTVQICQVMEATISIRSVVRALAVFDCFDAEHLNLSLKEISQRLDLAKSTTSRLVSTLVETGYLMQLEDQRFCISFKLLRLGGLVQSNLGVQDVVRAVMRRVHEITGETISLSILVGNQRVTINAIESKSSLKAVVNIGETITLAVGGVGQVFLAFNPDLSRDEIFSPPYERPANLEDGLEKVRSQGYAYSTGDRVPGAAGIAAPIFGLNDVNTHCLSISGPEARIASNKDKFTSVLVAAASRISAQLGSSNLKLQSPLLKDVALSEVDDIAID